MTRTQRDQWILRVRNDGEANRMTAAGEHWVRADAVARWLAMQVGERKYDYEKMGREPWSEYVRRSFYVVFDALPAEEQAYFVKSHDALAVPMPERPAPGRLDG